MDQTKISRRKNLMLAVSSFVFALSMGCSKQSFSVAPSLKNKCDLNNPEKSCVTRCEADGTNCKRDYDYDIDVQTSIADILFVVDNSGSMSPEQRLMGSKFPSFLDSISHLDYRIGVTTTDISSLNNPAGPTNGFGAFQDGKLIEFEAGRSYLNGSLPLIDEEDLFLETVKRDETQVCEDNNYDWNFCPSGDERGILASYLTIATAANTDFLRDSGHLAIVVLSDEDERSEGETVNKPFDSVERPQGFVDSVRTLYPDKTLKVHSIVIQPGDSACLAEQSQPGTPVGFYGDTYAELTALTDGIHGSICDDNYSALLQDIGDEVAIPREALPCRPIADQLDVEFIPEPSYQVDIYPDFDRLEVSFSRALPKGTKIRFKFSCAL